MPDGQFTSCRCGVRYANESLTHFMGRDQLALKSPNIRTTCRRCYQSVLWATSGWFGMHSWELPGNDVTLAFTVTSAAENRFYQYIHCTLRVPPIISTAGTALIFSKTTKEDSDVNVIVYTPNFWKFAVWSLEDLYLSRNGLRSAPKSRPQSRFTLKIQLIMPR